MSAPKIPPPSPSMTVDSAFPYKTVVPAYSDKTIYKVVPKVKADAATMALWIMGFGIVGLGVTSGILLARCKWNTEHQ